jgi:type IV secretory pathway VirB3-like protein
MRRSPLARALTTNRFGMGMPMPLIAIIWLPSILIFILTQWMWFFLPVSLVIFLIVKGIYKKDENTLKYFVDAMKRPQHYDP